MRIIGGSAKGRVIKTPKDNDITRPALAKVREAIFSSLGEVENLVTMDVFAGSGSLGLEALSRGAKFSYFVEAHPRAIACLIENLKFLGFSDQAKIFQRSMPHGMKNIRLNYLPDIIFCDPPYDKNLINPTLSALIKQGLVAPQTLILVEHTRREMPCIKELEVIKERQYGQTIITYLKLASETSPAI